ATQIARCPRRRAPPSRRARADKRCGPACRRDQRGRPARCALDAPLTSTVEPALVLSEPVQLSPCLFLSAAASSAPKTATLPGACQFQREDDGRNTDGRLTPEELPHSFAVREL